MGEQMNMIGTLMHRVLSRKVSGENSKYGGATVSHHAVVSHHNLFKTSLQSMHLQTSWLLFVCFCVFALGIISTASAYEYKEYTVTHAPTYPTYHNTYSVHHTDETFYRDYERIELHNRAVWVARDPMQRSNYVTTGSASLGAYQQEIPYRSQYRGSDFGRTPYVTADGATYVTRPHAYYVHDNDGARQRFITGSDMVTTGYRQYQNTISDGYGSTRTSMAGGITATHRYVEPPATTRGTYYSSDYAYNQYGSGTPASGMGTQYATHMYGSGTPASGMTGQVVTNMYGSGIPASGHAGAYVQHMYGSGTVRSDLRNMPHLRHAYGSGTPASGLTGTYVRQPIIYERRISGTQYRTSISPTGASRPGEPLYYVTVHRMREQPYALGTLRHVRY